MFARDSVTVTASTNKPGVESEWAGLRDAQAAALELPYTGMAVTLDLGEEKDGHPRKKWGVGQRLAWSALSQAYEFSKIPAAGPRFEALILEGDRVRIFFDLFGSSLAVRGESLDGFVVAGSDGVLHWANAQLEGDTVVLSASQVSSSQFVRFAWADNPACTLYNTFGQPAAPFQINISPSV